MFRYLSKAKAMLALLAAIVLGVLVSCNQTEEAPETVMGFTCLIHFRRRNTACKSFLGEISRTISIC